MSKRLSGRHGALFSRRCLPLGQARSLPFLLLLLVAPAPPQSAEVPAQQQPVFEATVERVRVDVIVTNADDQFVGDLGFEDFRLYEDGAPRQILSVQLVDLGAGTVADIEPLPSEQVTGRVRMDPAAETPEVHPVGNDYGAMIFLIDAASLDPRARIRFARQWGEMLGEAQILNVPRAAYMLDQTGRLRELTSLTHDVDALRGVADAVQADSALGTSMGRKLVGLLNDSQDPATSGDAIRQARAYEAEERFRSYITLDILTQFCDALAARSGRTALVWVSSGVKLTEGGPFWAIAGNDPAMNLARDRGILDRQAALHEAANSANVSIYSIDPTTPGDLQSVGFDPSSQRSGSGFAREEFDPSAESEQVDAIDDAIDGMRDSLRHAATATGGEAFIMWGDTARALRTIEEDGRRYYLLTYAVPSPLGDDEYHEIQVEVQRPDVNVRARGGYVDLAPVDRLTRSVAAALILPGSVAATPVGVRAFRRWSAEGEPVIDLAITVEGEQAARGAMAAGPDSSMPWRELHAMALDGAMEMVDEFHIAVQPPGDPAAPRPFVYLHAWALPPGEHDIRVVVNDEGGGRLSAAQLAVEVPASAGEWATSDLVLTVTDGHRPSQPLIENELFPGETLEIHMEVDGGREPVFSGRVLGPDPEVLVAELPGSPMTRDSTGIHRGSLWLEEMPPGSYTLEVRVADPLVNEEREFRVPLQARPAIGLDQHPPPMAMQKSMES